MLCDIFSLQGISQLHETVERIKANCNPNLAFAGILLTDYNPKTRLSQEILGTTELISRDLNIPVFHTCIRKSVIVSKTQSAQRSLLDYAPRNAAAVSYRQSVDELLGSGI